MKVRRSMIHKFNKDSQVRKALALSLYCKDELGIHYVKDFTYNKLHTLTGIHVTTLKKRVRLLMQIGLAFMEGSKLVFKKVHKDNERNNITLATDHIHTLKDYEYAIISMGVAIIQANKNFAKSVIDKCSDPKNLKEYKSGVKKFPSTFNQHQIEFVCALSVAVSLCPSDSVIIQSNNQYVVNALTKDEVSADAANARLIDRYKEASMALNAELKWVKKDDNDLFAQICDAMAVAEMEQ